jgi:hypothetical protein
LIARAWQDNRRARASATAGPLPAAHPSATSTPRCDDRAAHGRRGVSHVISADQRAGARGVNRRARSRISTGMHLRSLVALLSLVAASSACHLADAQVKGSGAARTEARAVGSFSKLSAGGAIHLTITVGGATAVTVTADDNVVPLIRTRVQADRLIIDTADGYTPRTPVAVVVTTPRLTALGLSGATTAEARGLTGDRFALDLSGASHATLTGATTAIAIEASGAAQLDGRALATQDATVSASGASQLELAVARALTVEASGASEVAYRGTPAVTKATSGTSRVRRR